MNRLTPRQIVEELNKYIIGQDSAKRKVAIALRNRWRRQHLPEDLRDEVAPKNIIMIGPTGVGKTEIARRLARLADAPFLKVEASKFTEVGYVGRDVESIIRELTEVGVSLVREEMNREMTGEAKKRAEEKLMDLLLPPAPRPMRPPMRAPNVYSPADVGAGDEPAAPLSRTDQAEVRVRELLLEKLRRGEFEEREVEVEVRESSGTTPMMQVFSNTGMEEMGLNMQEMFGRLFPARKKRKKLTVAEARKILEQEVLQELVDQEALVTKAIARTEDAGIVFLDEIDKIAGRSSPGHGPDVSREGVQRDILPIVEGSTVTTKYGPVRTDHILFIAAGAFHMTKVSDLIPELQGRFPIRVELDSLDAEDFERILREPQNSLIKQYQALLATEGVTVEFEDEAIGAIARICQKINEETENIGARRLHTVMEYLLEDISFEAPETRGRAVRISAADVEKRLAELAEDQDMSRYIL
ncbi:MAG: ATP-dependent protease ATPase subunit HslU [Candidatus Hydrogenedentes bacterium]|nr:ATP-dependent protease ATPase subunit HslU [Candidatus Hydrogenedentota bacterium]